MDTHTLGSGAVTQQWSGIKPCQPRHGGISPDSSIRKHIFLTSPSAQLALGELQLLALVIQLSSQCTLLLFLATANLFCTLTSRYGGCVCWVVFGPNRIYLELETNANQALASFAMASLMKIVSLQFLTWPF